ERRRDVWRRLLPDPARGLRRRRLRDLLEHRAKREPGRRLGFPAASDELAGPPGPPVQPRTRGMPRPPPRFPRGGRPTVVARPADRPGLLHEHRRFAWLPLVSDPGGVQWSLPDGDLVYR